MPLKRGNDRATIESNVREMVRAGHPQDQAVAAALNTADKPPKHEAYRRGGAIHHDAAGRYRSAIPDWAKK